MLRYWIFLLVGIVIPSFLPQLPSLIYTAYLFLAVLVFLLFSYYLRLRILKFSLFFFCLVVGFSWGVYQGYRLVGVQLPTALIQENLWVRGHIASLVDANAARVRFVIHVDTASATDSFMEPYNTFSEKIQVSWYRAPTWVSKLTTGDYLQLQVRLKRPRGFVNPAGFDYQLWQLRRGIGAVGYVRKHKDNRLWPERHKWSVRGQLNAWLNEQAPTYKGLMQALLLGNRSSITTDDWEILQKTGTNHLIAISGLHIGLVAGFTYFFGLWFGRLLSMRTSIRAQSVGFLVAALCAVSYSALAGFSLPTERALIMLLLMQWSFWRGRPCSGANIYYSTVLLVIVLDPQAIFDAGFWLSFGAVGALILTGGGRLRVKQNLWQRFGYAQWIVFMGLFVPLTLLFQQVSMIAPLANIIAIPLVSLCVLPALLLAAVSSVIWAPLSGVFLWIADAGLSVLWWWLELLLKGESWLQVPITFNWALAPSSQYLALLAAFTLLLPKGLKLGSLAVVSLGLVLCLPPKAPPPLSMTVLDVGQGLAVVIRVGTRTLLYDAGPFYSDRFNAGGGIIAPYLHKLGINHVDALIISHAHMDHSGGVSGLLKKVGVNQLYFGEPLPKVKLPHTANLDDCSKKKQWQWQAVSFTLLPTPKRFWQNANNASCVLLVEYEEHRLLLTGDIERDMETYLLKSNLLKGENIEVLIAPHHGSKTSSSKGFVKALKPAHVVFSTGYRNRHRHPHQQVVKRYKNTGSTLYNTAYTGAVSFLWNDDEAISIVSERIDFKRFWYE